MALLEARELTARFGALAAVDNVTFSVERGERLAIIGPNGAGKTTLFNVLTGQLKPSSGNVLFKGQDITNSSAFARAHLGMGRSFQITSLFADETVLINAMIAVQGTKRKRYGMRSFFTKDRELRADAQKLLESADMWELREEIVKSLAYGQQRKLEIALSMACDPEVLLLDEPSCGLTTAESAEITSRLRDLGSQFTLIVIAHDMDLVFGVAQRLILLHYGQIVCEGTPESIRSNQTAKEIYMGSRKSIGRAG
jgi:branched-chain amino acid transport system ATP-binding protein